MGETLQADQTANGQMEESIQTDPTVATEKTRIPYSAYLSETQAGKCVDATCGNLNIDAGQFGLCTLRVAFERNRSTANLKSAPTTCPDQAILAAKVAPTA